MSDTNQEATSVLDIVDVLVNQRNIILAVNANLEAKLTLALKQIDTLKRKIAHLRFLCTHRSGQKKSAVMGTPISSAKSHSLHSKC